MGLLSEAKISHSTFKRLWVSSTKGITERSEVIPWVSSTNGCLRSETKQAIRLGKLN